MSHVLSREKREQVIALGRLGWSLRRIEQATGVRRETAGDYLRVAGIALRRPGGWGRQGPSKPAIDLITDSEGGDSKAAIEVITDLLARKPGCGPASNCEPYRELNPLYRDVLAHYSVTALPCKVRDPDRKGKVESGVNHAQMTPLKGKKFESLEEAQAYLDHWEERWADTRIHGRTKRQVAAMFAEEKPHLQPLPLEPFRYYQYGERTVHLDGCVEVEAAYYGAPPGWIGRKVNVQWDAMFVRLVDPRTGELLREHLSGKRGAHRIRAADRPRRTPPALLQLLARAHKAGANIGAVCDAIHARQGELGMRRIQGVLRLVKQYGSAASDGACAAALELRVPEYRFVRRYLERSPQAPLTLRQVDPLIRELSQYRDLIQQRINFEEPNP
jgi:hypothetical protein